MVSPRDGLGVSVQAYPLDPRALEFAGAQGVLAVGVDVQDGVLQAIEEAAELRVELVGRARDGRNWRYSGHGAGGVWRDLLCRGGVLAARELRGDFLSRGGLWAT